MRDLTDRETQDLRTAVAVALFCNQARKMDRRIRGGAGRTGHVGVRWSHRRKHGAICPRICERLNFLGIELNELLNTDTVEVIFSDASQVTVRLICTGEELMIARSAWRAERTILEMKCRLRQGRGLRLKMAPPHDLGSRGFGLVRARVDELDCLLREN